MTETERRLRALEGAAERRRTSLEDVGRINILDHIAPVYRAVHDDIRAGAHQYYNLPGGRGSGKSSFCALEIIDAIMKDPTGRSNAIIFRRTGNTMRDSVFSQIAWAVDLLDVNSYWKSSVMPMCFTYTPTGAQIFFRGLDDSSKLKSIKPRRGYFRFIWLEEFSELPGENFTRSVMQSVIRGAGPVTVFRSFNPPISKNNWANLFIEKPDPRALTVRTTYLDVPGEWLGEDFIYQAERLKEINPTAYDNEYLGIATGSGGEVFPGIEVRKIPDTEADTLDYIFQGLDFGFSVDPACFLRVAYDSKHDTVFLLDEIYKKHLSNAELAEEIKARGYDKRPSGSGLDAKMLITADSAEPKSINDLRAAGLKVLGCHKYPGSVLYGIKWLQNRRIVIDPARTPNAHREFVGYEYSQSKDGEFLADVPDKDNHTIDSCRYSLDSLINRRGVSA